MRSKRGPHSQRRAWQRGATAGLQIGTWHGQQRSGGRGCPTKAQPATSIRCCRRCLSRPKSGVRCFRFATTSSCTARRQRACRCSCVSSSRGCSTRSESPSPPASSPHRSGGVRPTASGSTMSRSCAACSSRRSSVRARRACRVAQRRSWSSSKGGCARRCAAAGAATRACAPRRSGTFSSASPT